MMLVVRLTVDGSVREEDEGEMVRRILSTVTHLQIEGSQNYHVYRSYADLEIRGSWISATSVIEFDIKTYISVLNWLLLP